MCFPPQEPEVQHDQTAARPQAATVSPEDRERIEEWVAAQAAHDPDPTPVMVEAVYRILRPSACDPRHWIRTRRTRSRT